MNGSLLLQQVREWATVILSAVAALFALAGAAGLFRFRDPYRRLQASSLLGTTATFTVFLACIVATGELSIVFRIVAIGLFFFVSAPTATHIVARFAWRGGVEPEQPAATKIPAAKPAVPGAERPAIPADTAGEERGS